MKTLVKTIAPVVAIAIWLMASSCQKHTCPTYSKVDTKQTEERV